MLRYQPGAVLRRHVDRAQCRWNVSFCVDIEAADDEAPWPLHIGAGAGQAVHLGIGDAVVYCGTDVPHWREPLPDGKFVTVCLFHYVDDVTDPDAKSRPRTGVIAV